MHTLNLFEQPLVNTKVGTPPLFIKTLNTVVSAYIMGGVPQKSQVEEVYIRLSALPVELQQRVNTAMSVILSGLGT